MKRRDFKVGDKVIHKRFPNWGMGEITEITGAMMILVKWNTYWRWPMSHTSRVLEFYETPIQRMRRLYSED